MELMKAKTHFVADGHRRWTAARKAKIRAEISQQTTDGNQPAGFPGKFRRWLKFEMAAFRGRPDGEKSSPKILW